MPSAPAGRSSEHSVDFTITPLSSPLTVVVSQSGLVFFSSWDRIYCLKQTNTRGARAPGEATIWDDASCNKKEGKPTQPPTHPQDVSDGSPVYFPPVGVRSSLTEQPLIVSHLPHDDDLLIRVPNLQCPIRGLWAFRLGQGTVGDLQSLVIVAATYQDVVLVREKQVIWRERTMDLCLAAALEGTMLHLAFAQAWHMRLVVEPPRVHHHSTVLLPRSITYRCGAFLPSYPLTGEVTSNEAGPQPDSVPASDCLYIAFGSPFSRIDIFNLEGELVDTICAHKGIVFALTYFRHNGYDFLSSASDDRTVLVYQRLSTWSLRRSWKYLHRSRVWEICHIPNVCLLTAGEDGRVTALSLKALEISAGLSYGGKVSESAAGSQQGVRRYFNSQGVGVLSVSHDSGVGYAALQDGRLICFDLDARWSQTYKGTADHPKSVVFLPGSKVLSLEPSGGFLLHTERGVVNIPVGGSAGWPSTKSPGSGPLRQNSSSKSHRALSEGNIDPSSAFLVDLPKSTHWAGATRAQAIVIGFSRSANFKLRCFLLKDNHLELAWAANPFGAKDGVYKAWCEDEKMVIAASFGGDIVVISESLASEAIALNDRASSYHPVSLTAAGFLGKGQVVLGDENASLYLLSILKPWTGCAPSVKLQCSMQPDVHQLRQNITCIYCVDDGTFWASSAGAAMAQIRTSCAVDGSSKMQVMRRIHLGMVDMICNVRHGFIACRKGSEVVLYDAATSTGGLLEVFRGELASTRERLHLQDVAGGIELVSCPLGHAFNSKQFTFSSRQPWISSLRPSRPVSCAISVGSGSAFLGSESGDVWQWMDGCALRWVGSTGNPVKAMATINLSDASKTVKPKVLDTSGIEQLSFASAVSSLAVIGSTQGMVDIVGFDPQSNELVWYKPIKLRDTDLNERVLSLTCISFEEGRLHFLMGGSSSRLRYLTARVDLGGVETAVLSLRYVGNISGIPTCLSASHCYAQTGTFLLWIGSSDGMVAFCRLDARGNVLSGSSSIRAHERGTYQVNAAHGISVGEDGKICLVSPSTGQLEVLARGPSACRAMASVKLEGAVVDNMEFTIYIVEADGLMTEIQGSLEGIHVRRIPNLQLPLAQPNCVTAVSGGLFIGGDDGVLFARSCERTH